VDIATPNLVGVGLYTVPEAARLTRVAPAKIRGWISGYGGRAKDDRAPIIHRQIPMIGGKPALGFLDLIEVRFVSWLVGKGVSWRTIRLAADRARAELHHEHPFALARFHTDGKAIFLETQEATGDRSLLDLVKNNFAMYEVVLDPGRSFGRPIDDGSGVPTATLNDAYQAEGSYERVASWFEVPPEAVRRAVAYEMKLAA